MGHFLIQMPPGDPAGVTFDEAAARLAALPRLYFEPDGSFVWVDSDGARRWQLDGQLNDRGKQLDHVELKGSCTAAACAALLACFGWPNEALRYFAVAAGAELSHDEFCAALANSGD